MAKKQGAAAPTAALKFDPSQNVSRAQGVYDSLREAIRNGTLERGQRVREEAVARLLGVSRTPVREALARLQASGLLEISAGGLVVPVLTRPQTTELYAMREILEGSAARFAAQHASGYEVATLRQVSRAFGDALGNPARLAQLNIQLHAAICEIARNRYLLRMLNELKDALALLPSTTFAIEGRPKRAIAEHERIIDAIEQHDADAAEAAAREHIRKAQETRLSMMFDLH